MDISLLLIIPLLMWTAKIYYKEFAKPFIMQHQAKGNLPTLDKKDTENISSENYILKEPLFKRSYKDKSKPNKKDYN